jgi:hypothetical protein
MLIKKLKNDQGISYCILKVGEREMSIDNLFHIKKICFPGLP